MAHGLETIDWCAPWLAPYQQRGEPAATLVEQGATVCDALNSAASAPVRFVPQSELPVGRAYEDHIFQTGNCPTRDGPHDFFNGLCWLHLPLTKQKLNRIQAAQIAAAGITGVRGRVRDAATLLDENGAIFQGPDALWQALLAKDWQRLLVELRPLWAQAQLLLLGHALMEKLLTPRKSMTAHVYRAQTCVTPLAELDRWLAQDLSADKLALKPFAPLPVLGVPGWCPANADLAFYRDAAVFRSPRPEAHLTTTVAA
jgi:hypothetical protein